MTAATRPIVTGYPSTMGDDAQLNTTTLIRHAARTHGEREIVFRTPDGDWDRYTYADAYARVQRGANALRGLGVQPGDRVGILDWNSRRHFELYWAIPGIAACMVQLNLRLSPPDLTYVLSDSGTSVVLVDETLLPLAEAIAPNLPGVKEWVVMTDKPLSEITTSLEHVRHFEDLLDAAEETIDWPEVDEKSAYGACYTTGTTGRPKGVYYSHRAIFLPMLRYIETLDDKPDLSRLRMMSGATEPPLSMMRGFRDLTGAEVVHAYGATETTPMVTVNRYKPSVRERLSDDELFELKRKQGFPVTGVDIRLVDELDEDAAWDGVTPGEICVRGPWIATSYHGMSAEDSADRFLDGWWRSGDVGTIDPDAYLKVTDRLKDVIKSGGEWISSIDMENLLLSHPAVAEAAVVGLQHPQWQERPFVLVAPKQGAEITLEEIREHLSSAFAKWPAARGARDREPDPEDERGQVRQEGHPRGLRRRLRRGNGR